MTSSPPATLPAPPAPGQKSVLAAAVIAAVLSGLFFLAVGRVNFNPTEEGYLWYGTLRTAAGEVPIRDFQSYDPGRYYWCAWLGELLGHGVIGLRASVACFQALGIFFGLLAARRVLRSDWAMIPVGLLLLAWMFPRHKLFESALSLTSVFFAVRLFERPDARRHLEAGIFAGFAGVFGRNHAVYCVGGFLVLAAVIAWRQRSLIRDQRVPGVLTRLGSSMFGVVLGYSPILVMLIFVPGFDEAFWRSILILLKLGANIPHAWPWPWNDDWENLDALGWIVNVGKAFWFLIPFVVFPVGLLTLVLTPTQKLVRRALFLSGAVLGLFYMHHASVRSDAAHIAQSIDPTLLAVVGQPAAVAWRGGEGRFVLWGLVGLFTVGSTLGVHQLLSRKRLAERERLVEHDLAGDTVRLTPGLAAYYRNLEETIHGRVPEGEAIFFAPSRPGFYAIFERVCPTWWIYFFVPELGAESQNTILERLADVDWVLLVDVPIASQDRFLFKNTCPFVWDELRREFQRVPTPKLPPNHLLLRRKED